MTSWPEHRARARILILCADIGEGHVTVARSLAEELEARADVEAVDLRTDLNVMGPRLGRFLSNGFHTHLDEIGWTYDLAYRVFFERAAPRQAAHLALAVLGARGLQRTIRGFSPHVVVAEYPVLSAALGQLRALGRLPVPVCSSVSDPAGLYYWAHPGIDLHLLSWPEALPEAERIAGPGSAIPVRPLIHRRFIEVPSRQAARERLSLPAEVPVVLVSGGGWGMGDLVGAAGVVLTTVPDAITVCLAGHSARAMQQLEQGYGGERRVRVLGFSEQMPELLAAADALIHTTGGTTALEARVVGCRLINYGTSVAHVRAHARAMAAQGLAEWAPDRAALAPALVRTLSAPRPAPLVVDALPKASDLVVRLALGEPPRRGGERFGSRTRDVAELGPRLGA